MKKQFFITASVILFCASKMPAQQISNGGMENWQNHGVYSLPDSFATMDSTTLVLTGVNIFKSTDAHSGSNAALLETVASTFGFNSPGILSYNWPFIYKPSKLRFWYKYQQAGSDTGYANIVIKAGSSDAGVGICYFTSNANVYTLMEVPIAYGPPGTPDSIMIEFHSSYGNPIAGTQLYIDDVSLVILMT